MPNDVNSAYRAPEQDSIPFLPFLPLPSNLPPRQIAIAEMADAFGVTHRTLHFYEEKGLMTATRLGTMRVYDMSHARRMAVINACREIDMPIAVLQELMQSLSLADSQQQAEAAFYSALQARKRELTAQQSNLRRQMQKISELLGGSENRSGLESSSEQPVHLSPIEHRCVILMAEGFQASQIASIMDMDMTAVLTLETGIIRKFSAVNRFQAVAKAVLMGIVPQD
ncbi:MerR family transcriptional regulator [Pararhizobium sp.]|uniref:MerR family transcriptional regulator n=1 Tax=Pararhizobium sp. TaxID=1977563 RepID=UPI002715F438|nr:MerR family transcriptional regulator [Pararhizobium sp.]MDO9418770.1 MerR family transcriptional regulator [Pararhizobium sp.]